LCLTQCWLHALATLQTQIRRALEALTTRRRLALTGYPLQNNLSEM
jgi:SNF2 family DNA or RNA helicase